MNRILILSLSFGLALVGCEKSPEPKAVDRETTPKCVSATNGMVAVRIDGKDLLRKEIIRDANVVLLLNMNKARKTKIKQREIKAAERYCRNAVNREIGRCAVAKYVEEKGLSVPTDVMKRATRRFERQYGAMSRKLRRMHNLADLKCMLGKNASRADEMIREMALYEVMTNDIARQSVLRVTDEMVKHRLALIDASNLRAKATNDMIFAKATNVWKRIVSKELTFEDAARKFSEDEYIADGCEWGCFTREQLESDPAVLALLPTLKTGDITPPVESDAGLAILRKDEDDNDKTFSFSRVFFRLPYFCDKETPEQARAVLYEEQGRQRVHRTMQEYIGKLKIEYPNGTNMTWKLTPRDFK